MTGMFPVKEAIVAKKSPNSTKMPYSSTRNPVNGHRRRMRIMPPKNAAVPFHFCRLAKNTKVFRSPIISVRPIMKRIYKRFSFEVRERSKRRQTLPIASLSPS